MSSMSYAIMHYPSMDKPLYFVDSIDSFSCQFDDTHSFQRFCEMAEAYQAKGYYVIMLLDYEIGELLNGIRRNNEDRNGQQGEKQHGNRPIAHCIVFDEAVAKYEFYQNETVKKTRKNYQQEGTDHHFEWTQSDAQLKESIEMVKSYIREGYTYQVNFTTRLQSQWKVCPFTFFEHALERKDGEYMSYIFDDKHHRHIISLSPELFFTLDEVKNTIVTSPMKGTLSKNKEPQLLRDSIKDRAENVMIVDLLRNDLSKISGVKSVHVDPLFEVKSYPTVWQMISTITAKYSNQVSLYDVLNQLFPCGSITGAPKISTMNFIKHLEPENRGIYCGSIGLMLPKGESIFNVAIRTLEIKDDIATYGVGAGITINSKADAEVEEFKDKTKVLDQLKLSPLYYIETFKSDDVENIPLHIDRLERSSKVNQDVLLNRLKKQLEEHLTDDAHTVRMTVTNSGNIDFDHRSLPSLDGENTICISTLPILKSPLTSIKTNRRYRFPQRSNEQNYYVYYNEEGMIVECDIGNIIYCINDVWYTPSIEAGALPGIQRQKMLEQHSIFVKDIHVNEFIDLAISQINNIKIINSLRGTVNLHHIKID